MVTDTHPEAEAGWLDLLRQMTVEQQLTRMVTLTQTARTVVRQGIAQARPELSSREQDRLFAEVQYGSARAARVRDCLAEREAG